MTSSRTSTTVLLGLALLLVSCGGNNAGEVAPEVSRSEDDVQLTAEAVRLAGIETAPVRRESVARSLTLSGSLAGSPWTPAESDVLAAADAADAGLRLAESKAARLEALLAQGIVSRQDADVTRSELDRARAAAVELHAERDNLGLTGKTFVGGSGRIWGLATLPETQFSEVQNGIGVEVLTDAVPGRSFAGRVVDISGASDTQTRGFTIRVAIDDPAHQLRPQMLARFAIAMPPRTGLALPGSAVLLEGDGAYVYVARSATAFHRQAVHVDSVAPDRVLALDGVSDGEAVVVSGAQILEAERLKQSFTPIERD
jgi:multidrug efflux pump subunit AcrA (membrane-fusion protein)